MAQTPNFLPSKTPMVDERRFITHDWLLNMMSWIQSAAGAGNVDGPATAANNAIVLFSGLTGKIIKAATGSGLVVASSGIYSTLQLGASKLLGRGSAGGTGTPEEISLAAGLTMSGTTLTPANNFGTVAVSGQSDVVADSASDTLTLAAGTGISITTTPASDTVTIVNTMSVSITRAITFAIDGGSTALTTGIKADVYVPYAATITAVTMLADPAGAIVVDIWKVPYGTYPAIAANSIINTGAGGTKPTITATNAKSQSSTLTGWTTSISAGDTLRYNIDSVTSITRLNLVLTVTG